MCTKGTWKVNKITIDSIEFTLGILVNYVFVESK